MAKYSTPFSLLHAASLLSHKSRLEKFMTSIRHVVTEESLVIDIGTGAGVLAILAAKAGANRVIALDINENSIEYARAVAKQNGVDDRIEFIHSHFGDYYPSERADVVICEMLSSMMLVEQQIPAALHANNHILKKGGSLLPHKVDIYMVPVECDTIHQRWNFSDISFIPLPQTLDRDQATDLSKIALVKAFDFSADDIDTDVDVALSFNIVDDGTVTGFAGMFEACLLPDIKLSMEDGWRDLYLPLKKSLNAKKGDALQVHLQFSPGEFDTLSIDAEVF
jgi:predicted RNA methylase